MRVFPNPGVALAAVFLTLPVMADTLIVSNRGDESVQFVDTESGKTLATRNAGVGAHEFAVSPDGRTVVGSCYGSGPRHQKPDQRLLTFSMQGTWQPKQIDLGVHVRPNDLRFVDDRFVWVTSEVKQCVILVDLQQEQVVRAVSYGQAGGHMLAWSAQRNEAYVPCVPSGHVMVVDTQEHEAAEGETQPEPVLDTILLGRGAEGVDLSPDGRWLWVASHASQTITVIDAHSREVAETLPTDGHPFRVRFTPDGSTVVIAHPGAHEVRWYDAKTRKVAGKVTLPGGLPTSLAIGSQGRYAYAVCGPLREVVQIDLAEAKVSARYATGQEPDAVAITHLQSFPAVAKPSESEKQKED